MRSNLRQSKGCPETFTRQGRIRIKKATKQRVQVSEARQREYSRVLQKTNCAKSRRFGASHPRAHTSTENSPIVGALNSSNQGRHTQEKGGPLPFFPSLPTQRRCGSTMDVPFENKKSSTRACPPPFSTNAAPDGILASCYSQLRTPTSPTFPPKTQNSSP